MPNSDLTNVMCLRGHGTWDSEAQDVAWYTELALLERNKNGSRETMSGHTERKLAGNERGMQVSGMYVRTSWVENSESKFYRERKRTSHNNLTGDCWSPNSKKGRFLATVFWIQWHSFHEYMKAEISKIYQRGFALKMDRKKAVGEIVK